MENLFDYILCGGIIGVVWVIGIYVWAIFFAGKGNNKKNKNGRG